MSHLPNGVCIKGTEVILSTFLTLVSLKRPAFGVREGINISGTVCGFLLEIASTPELLLEGVMEA